MFRSTRALVRPLRPIAAPSSPSVALQLHKHKPLAIWRFASSDGKRDDPPPPKPKIDYEAERKIGEQKLQSDPSAVSIDSSTRANWDKGPRTSSYDDDSVQGGLKHDLGIVKDAFRLSKIPRESHILGLAGTIPYVATSLSTLYLAWDLSKELPTGSTILDSLFINHEQARYLLDIIEPLQLGYGAVIISFLGAIHWGLEYAEKAPDYARTRFRYGMGVAASVAAWPTVLLPIEYGLTTQSMAFVALYFADSRAATRGWAPRWYGQYRFLLTAMVGLAIFISLVGRSQIEKSERLSAGHLRGSMNRSGIADTETNWAKIEAEEKKKIKAEEEKKKKEEEKKAKQKKKNGEGKEKKDTKDSKEEKSDEKEEKKSDDKEEKKPDDKEENKSDDKDEKKSDEKKENKSDDKEDKKSDNKEEKKDDDKKDGDSEKKDDKKEGGGKKKDE